MSFRSIKWKMKSNWNNFKYILSLDLATEPHLSTTITFSPALQIMKQIWFSGYLMMVLKMIYQLLHWSILVAIEIKARRDRHPFKVKNSRKIGRNFIPPLTLEHCISYYFWIIALTNNELIILTMMNNSKMLTEGRWSGLKVCLWWLLRICFFREGLYG